jgi:hypothetical protein
MQCSRNSSPTSKWTADSDVSKTGTASGTSKWRGIVRVGRRRRVWRWNIVWSFYKWVFLEIFVQVCSCLHCFSTCLELSVYLFQLELQFAFWEARLLTTSYFFPIVFQLDSKVVEFRATEIIAGERCHKNCACRSTQKRSKIVTCKEIFTLFFLC